MEGLLRGVELLGSRLLWPALVIDAEASADTALRIGPFVFNIVFEKLLIMVKHDFVVEQVFELLRAQFVVFEVKVVGVEFVCYWLIFWVVEL